MRTKFRVFAEAHIPNFQVFFPEFAMKDFFSNDEIEPFDIASFEETVGELSHAIILFPEAPGSFAETGYFSLQSDLVKKTILVLDADRQAGDSFISMGPAQKFAEKSVFRPILQISYSNPDFSSIQSRVTRHVPSNRQALVLPEKFKDLPKFELFCLIQKIVSLLEIARVDDIVFILRALFSSQISLPVTKKIISVLVGASYLEKIGSYGYYRCAGTKPILASIRDGFLGEDAAIKLEMSETLAYSDQEFQPILAGVDYVA